MSFCWKRKPFCFFVLLIVLGVFHYSQQASAQESTTPKEFKIGVFQGSHHPIFDKMISRFQLRLSELLNGKATFILQVAEENPMKTYRMAQSFANNDYDLVFVVGAEQAQSLANETKSVPIVLGATDPVSAGILSDWNEVGKNLAGPNWKRLGRNITGTSDLSPIGAQLDYLIELIPKVRHVGMIFNPNTDNAKEISNRILRECRARRLMLKTVPVFKQDDVEQAFSRLAGRVDALYVPMDAVDQQAFSTISKLSTEYKVPIFSSNKSSVVNGAVFSVGFDYEELGRISAEMASKILLSNESPADMPIRFTESPILYFNTEKLDFFGLKLPGNWHNKGEVVTQ